MRCRPHCSVLSVMVLVGAGLVSADQRTWPTGTPTWVPKKAAETPVPEPENAVEREARALGKRLAEVDSATWQIVADSWSDQELCLSKVDAHLDQALAEAVVYLRSSEVMVCQTDEAHGQSTLALSSEEARKVFIEAYHPAVVKLRAVRAAASESPEAEAVVELVRQRQRDWQNRVCDKLSGLKTLKPGQIKMLDRPASSQSDS